MNRHDRLRYRLLRLEKDFQLNVLRVAFRDTPRQEVLDLPANPRILLLRNDRLGDAILTTGWIRELRRAWPNARIDVWARPGPGELLGALPAVNRVIPYGLPGSLGVVRGNRYDVAVNLSARAHGIHNQLLLGLSGARVRVGLHAGERPTTCHVPVPRDDRGHMIHYIGQLLRPFGIDPTAVDLSPELPGRVRDSGRDAIAINCFAGSHDRDWPLETARKLADMLRGERAPVIWLVPPGVPGPPLRDGETIASPAGPLAMIETLRDCSLVISPDTAWVHLAAAAGVPVVGLYGPDLEHQRRWGPWGVPHRIVSAERIATIPADAVAVAVRELR